MERLRVSDHVRVVPRGDEHAVYHALYGRLCLLDPAGLELLDSFRSQEGRAWQAEADPAQAAFVGALRERWFLVPPGFDERLPIRQHQLQREAHLERGGLVRGLQLVLTNVCNFRCTYCFASTLPVPSAGNDKGRVTSMSPELAVASVSAFVQLARRNGTPALGIEFFGGEPLTNWPAIEAVLRLHGHGLQHGVRLHYSVTTNASLASDDLARVLRAYGVTVTVSYDTPSNPARRLRGGQSASAAIDRGLALFSRHGVPLTLNSVVNAATVDAFDPAGLVNVARTHGAAVIGLILDLDARAYADEAVTRRVADAVLETCREAARAGVGVTGYWHQIFEQIAGRQPLNLQKGYKTCAAEGCKLSVKPDGSVFVCECCATPMGHVNDLDAVLRSAAYRAYAFKAYQSAPDCQGCALEGFCSGVCMGSLEKACGELYVCADHACRLYRELTDRLIGEVDTGAVERLALAPTAHYTRRLNS